MYARIFWDKHMTTGRINQETGTRHDVFPELGGHRRQFFLPARSIREWTFTTHLPSSAFSLSSFIQLRTFGLSHTWQVHGNARTRRLLGCALGSPWRADFCCPRMLSVYRTLPSGRGARWRTTRNLEISHHVLPHNSFNRGFQPVSPTAPPQPPSRVQSVK
jgi:hypothetical protein